jgi:hypothetical protein
MWPLSPLRLAITLRFYMAKKATKHYKTRQNATKGNNMLQNTTKRYRLLFFYLPVFMLRLV